MKLVFIENNRPVTDSLKVAETFGKRHDRVLQDIRELDCSDEFRLHYFVESSYINGQNRSMPKVLMSEQGFAFLAFGYTGKEAARFKELYIAEFDKMRDELNNPQFALPQTMPEALRLLAAEMESKAIMAAEKEQLAIETAEQKQKLKEQEAPVAIYNLAISAHNSMSMQEVAKSLGTGRTRLFDILRSESIIMKGSTMPYQRYLDAGYFKVTERPRASGDTVINDPATRVTAKGFDYIARIIQKRAERNGQAAELLERR
jgi:anti-repressor protein